MGTYTCTMRHVSVRPVGSPSGYNSVGFYVGMVLHMVTWDTLVMVDDAHLGEDCEG